jgi:threonine dehydrogenase-like Zn-dependent dehydrogenase
VKVKNMHAIWLENQKLSYLDTLNDPVPQEGEALIKMQMSGICSTDLELVKGYYPYRGVLGHEFVGEVIQSPGVEGWIGKRVVGEINISCGECSECLAGRKTHCSKRTVLGIISKDGVFANYLTLPVANLHLVPASVEDAAAVFTEPLAAALEILQQIHLHPGDRVLVVGAGRLGQLIARVLALTGCQLYVLARHEKQKRLLAVTGCKLVDRETLPYQSMDIVVEATGSPDGFIIARKTVRPRGTIILKSTYRGDLQMDISRIVVDEIQLIGSRCGPFAPALKLLENKIIDPTDLIEEIYPISAGITAFDFAAKPGIFKVLLKPE